MTQYSLNVFDSTSRQHWLGAYATPRDAMDALVHKVRHCSLPVGSKSFRVMGVDGSIVAQGDLIHDRLEDTLA